MDQDSQPTKGLTLVIPDKPDVERDAVAASWHAQGGTVLRLGRFWEPPALDVATIRVYGNETFALVLAQKLGRKDNYTIVFLYVADGRTEAVKKRIEC